MGPTTAVRCPSCGYDGNNPFFRYCGICGTPLKDAQAAAALGVPAKSTQVQSSPAPSAGVQPKPVARKSPPLTVSSFSILGLQDDQVIDEFSSEPREAEFVAGGAQANQTSSGLPYSPRHPLEPSDNVHYLLRDEEDEEQRHGASGWRLYVVLALFAASAGALAWQWRREGAPWRFFVPPAAQSHVAPVQQIPVAPTNPVATVAPLETATPTPASAAPSNSDSLAQQALPATSAAPATKPVESDAPQAATTAIPPEPAAQEDHAVAPAVTHPVAAASVPTAQDGVGSQDAVPASAPPVLDSMQLFEEGQKYLYGDGVAKDCARALQNLRESARTNAEAAGLLGTMYASGHCVGRNLAPAYRWYARALHREPANARFQSDLEVLWKQMTPAEKQAATRITP